MEINKLIDLYEERKVEKEKNIRNFFTDKTKPFLVMQTPPGNVWGRCNTIEEIYANNIKYFKDCLLNQFTDTLPYLEPWIGVGVYANAFGCEYLWREDNAPDTHYKYHKIDEVKNIGYPDWRKAPLMKMVIDCINHFNDKTKGKLPIVLTDTQSPFDTATLILETTEFFTSCYMNEEIIRDFMQKITNLIIEFSKEQMLAIGESALVRPGHIFPAMPWMKGIALSDDNIAVASPDINESIAMPFNQQIADAFDGLAVHSCGPWAHTMSIYKNIKGLMMIDCAVDLPCDPNPNKPSDVRNAMSGSGVVTKVRMGNDLKQIEKILKDLIVPDLQVIVQVEYDEGRKEEIYKRTTGLLEKLYEKASVTT
jgi:hypothetical protein